MLRRAVTIPLLLPLLLGGCTAVFFQPYRGQFITPARLHLEFEDVYFRSPDNVLLHGWFLPADGKALGTVLFLHGNAENISTHIGSVYWMPAAHLNVFLIDYRGYGLSDGVATLPGVIADAESALRALVKRSDVDPNNIILFGQSLGGAIATYVAAHSPLRSHLRALVIDSTFADYHRIAREKLAGFWLTWPFQYPLSFTVNDDYSPIKAIPAVSPIPVLIIHSERDQIIPIQHARDLYGAAREPKTLWLLPTGGHIQTFNQPENRQHFLQYVQQWLQHERSPKK